MGEMNITKEIQRINEREAALGLKASWHDEYANSPYIFVGNLDHGLTEGDIVAVFEQYGRVRDLNRARDKKTGDPKGFAFLGYQDPRSCILAVDNLNGIQLVGRTLRVDHVKDYKPPKDEEEEKKKKRKAEG